MSRFDSFGSIIRAIDEPEAPGFGERPLQILGRPIRKLPRANDAARSINDAAGSPRAAILQTAIKALLVIASAPEEFTWTHLCAGSRCEEAHQDRHDRCKFSQSPQPLLMRIVHRIPVSLCRHPSKTVTEGAADYNRSLRYKTAHRPPDAEITDEGGEEIDKELPF